MANKVEEMDKELFFYLKDINFDYMGSCSVKASYDKIEKIFGEPTIFLPFPDVDDEELIDFRDKFGIEGESFWVFFGSDGSDPISFVIEAENSSRSHGFASVSSDSNIIIKKVCDFISSDDWGDLDDVRVESFLSSI